jgi:hypothetical protein
MFAALRCGVSLRHLVPPTGRSSTSRGAISRSYVGEPWEKVVTDQITFSPAMYFGHSKPPLPRTPLRNHKDDRRSHRHTSAPLLIGQSSLRLSVLVAIAGLQNRHVLSDGVKLAFGIGAETVSSTTMSPSGVSTTMVSSVATT